MKKLLLVAVATLSVAFLLSFVLSVAFLSGLDQVWASPSPPSRGDRVVAVLLPSERDPFWDDLVASLRKVGGRGRIAFEVTRYSSSAANARERLEKLSLSLVDAVLCYPPDFEDMTAVIDVAEGRGLPVLLLENDFPNSRRRVFLGSSSFQVGHEVGTLIRSIPQGPRRVGILLSQSNLVRQTVRNSLFLNGLNEGMSLVGGDFTLNEVISPPGRFAGEDLVWSLLRKEPLLQVLVTTNPKDTSSALQAIVEANKVGKTLLVGVGEEPALREALAQRVLSGLITRDPDEWATTIDSTLQTLFSGQTNSSYVNLPVHPLRAPEAVHGD